jgi:LuxR family quorum-sensing system transcriptional regulator SolR
MNIWQEDHLQALLKIRTERDLFDHLAHTARQMDFEFCAYGIQMPIPISRPLVTMFNNYPSAWQDSYVANAYIDIDPTVQHGRKSCLPIIWRKDLSDAAPAFWEEARSHGLNFGWAQAARDASGAVGMLTLARSTKQLNESDIFTNNARMSWLSQYAHVAMTQILLPKKVPESTAILTVREKEVLRWTAEGKTAYEIGQILSVSERTVNFHINNVVVKLDASNKTQAAVKATALGMLN